jgi:hypothetical protein
VIPFTLHPEAEAEIDSTAAVYEAQQRGLGASFVAAVERAILFLRTYPEAGTPTGNSFRRVLVRRFPYTVTTASTLKVRSSSPLVTFAAGQATGGIERDILRAVWLPPQVPGQHPPAGSQALVAQSGCRWPSGTAASRSASAPYRWQARNRRPSGKHVILTIMSSRSARQRPRPAARALRDVTGCPTPAL